MFDHTHYVPILKGKSGELDGVSHLSSAVKDKITPLIEVPPVDWDFDADAPKTTIDAHIAKLPDKIANCWETHRSFFVDATEIADYTTTQTGGHPLEVIFSGLRAKGMRAIPVTSIGKSAAIQSAIASIVATDRRGVCIRIGSLSLGNLAALQAGINSLLATRISAMPTLT